MVDINKISLTTFILTLIVFFIGLFLILKDIVIKYSFIDINKLIFIVALLLVATCITSSSIIIYRIKKETENQINSNKNIYKRTLAFLIISIILCINIIFAIK
jgi:hypothetical protein